MLPGRLFLFSALFSGGVHVMFVSPWGHGTIAQVVVTFGHCWNILLSWRTVPINIRIHLLSIYANHILISQSYLPEVRTGRHK